MRWNYLIWIIGAVWFGYWSFGALWTYYLDLEERRRHHARVRRHHVWHTELAQQQHTSSQCPFPDNLEIKEKIKDTVNCTDGNLHDGVVEGSATVILDVLYPVASNHPIISKEHLTCDNDETNYCSDEAPPSTEPITEEIVRSREETVATSNATYEQLATVEDSVNFTTSTDLSTLALSSVDPPPTVEAIIDVVESRGETLVTTTYEPQASTEHLSSASLKFTTSNDSSPLMQFSTNLSDSDVEENTQEILTNSESDPTMESHVQQQPELVVEDLSSFTETTTCFFVPSLISDATTLTQSLDKTASCKKSITVEGADGKTDLPPLTQSSGETLPSTEPITEEIVRSREETVATSNATYEQLATVEDSVNFTTSTDLSTLAQTSDETPLSTEAITAVAEPRSRGETMVTIYEPLASTVIGSSASCTDSSPLSQFSTTFSDTGMRESTKEVLTNNNAIMEPQKQPEVVVEGLPSWTETTTCFLVSSSLMTDTTTHSQSLDEIASCTEYTAVTVENADNTTDMPPTTKCSGETLSSTEPIAEDIVRSKEETTSSITYEQLAKVEDAGSFITSTDLSTFTQSSDKTSDSVEAIPDVVESRGETLVTTTYEAQASTVHQSSASLKSTDLSSLTKFSTNFSDTDMEESTKETMTNSSVTTEPQKLPEVVVESSSSFTETTTCFFVPSRMTDTITLTKSLDKTASCTESTTVTVQGSDSTTDAPPITSCSDKTPPSTEPITEEIVRSKEETVATSSEDSVSITTSTDMSTLTCTQSSDEKPPTTEATHDVVQSRGETVVTTYKPLADDEALGFLPVRQPLCFQPGSNKEKLPTLDCACQCNWCNEHVRNLPYTKVTACCLLEKKEKDWLNDDFYFLLHGTSSRSHSKRQSKKSVSKHSKCGQPSQTISNQRLKQAASPASYSAKSTKKNIEEKNKLNDELSFPQHASRCSFLTSDKQQIKSYAMATETANCKTQSSLSSGTQSQIPHKLDKGPTQRVQESYSGAVTSTKKNYSLPSISQAQSLSTDHTATPKDQKLSMKSYAVATKPTKTASPSSNLQPQALVFSGESSRNQGKGKRKNNARNGPNPQQTNNKKRSSRQKSSGKSVSTQRGSQRQRRPFQTQRS